ncbi:MAG: MFS transporter [Blastocatellia bacterium]|nr:MAG: MFS transporter [Blastocatellia bacterium]
MLAGFAAFLDLYSTQPLLPLLTRTFHATNFDVSLTITATTAAVALAAPFVGRLGDRFGLRTVIVASAFALATATVLAATATSLWTLIGWRFAQGLATPGLVATVIAYIHEEWPTSRVGRTTAAYVSGTVIGGVTGRLLGGVVAADVSWSSSFVVLGAIGYAVAAALWLWLLPERARRLVMSERSSGSLASHLRHPQLLATYAVGFCLLCTQVAMFTYVPFRLAGPPFSLSTAALGFIFLTYIVGAAVTPLAGRGIDAYGHRAVLVAALGLSAMGALMTLVPALIVITAGLSIFATGVFFAQAASSSHVAHHATHGRGLAVGLYATFYYIGGSVGGAVPAKLWDLGGWRTCVGFIIVVELTMLAIAGRVWTNTAGAAGLAETAL